MQPMSGPKFRGVYSPAEKSPYSTEYSGYVPLIVTHEDAQAANLLLKDAKSDRVELFAFEDELYFQDWGGAKNPQKVETREQFSQFQTLYSKVRSSTSFSREYEESLKLAKDKIGQALLKAKARFNPGG